MSGRDDGRHEDVIGLFFRKSRNLSSERLPPPRARRWTTRERADDRSCRRRHARMVQGRRAGRLARRPGDQRHRPRDQHLPGAFPGSVRGDGQSLSASESGPLGEGSIEKGVDGQMLGPLPLARLGLRSADRQASGRSRGFSGQTMFEVEDSRRTASLLAWTRRAARAMRARSATSWSRPWPNWGVRSRVRHGRPFQSRSRRFHPPRRS